ncbi:MAG: mechanosensitive ion channel family protein [bacterium]
MEDLGKWLGEHTGTLIVSGILVVVAMTAWWFIKQAFNRYIAFTEERDGKRNNAARTVKRIVKYVLFFIVFLTVLQVNGINLTSIITSLGLVGAVVGFTAQEVMKDFLMGLRITSEDIFKVGDVIKYGNNIGVVTKFTLLTTHIRDIYTRSILCVSNRKLEVVEVIAGMVDLRIGLSYTEDFEKVHKVMEQLASTMTERVPGITESLYKGTSEFNESSVNYMLTVFMDPTQMPQLRRNVLMEIQREFKKNDIIFPYPQLDVHFDMRNKQSADLEAYPDGGRNASRG